MNILPLHFYVNKVILYSMIKSKGDSGQSVVIGALLLLALFVAFISWFQITQVPILNQNAEAENNEMIRTEMFEFQEKSYDSILNDNVNQISFQTKVDYDYQISGFQDKIGQFSVTEFNNEPINVTSVTEFNNEPITVTDANQNVSGLPSSMISLKYTPSYIERTEIPFIYENGILIENQTTTRLDKGGQRFIRGNNIYMFEFETNFVALQSPRIVFFTVPDIDLQETTITGANDGNGQQNITIELDTNLSVKIWKRLLSNQGHVKDVSDNGGSIIITLDGTEEYKLSTGKAIIEQ